MHPTSMEPALTDRPVPISPNQPAAIAARQAAMTAHEAGVAGFLQAYDLGDPTERMAFEAIFGVPVPEDERRVVYPLTIPGGAVVALFDDEVRPFLFGLAMCQLPVADATHMLAYRPGLVVS
jgi:hypothetical protein